MCKQGLRVLTILPPLGTTTIPSKPIVYLPYTYEIPFHREVIEKPTAVLPWKELKMKIEKCSFILLGLIMKPEISSL
jgi:hypothetical protein